MLSEEESVKVGEPRSSTGGKVSKVAGSKVVVVVVVLVVVLVVVVLVVVVVAGVSSVSKTTQAPKNTTMRTKIKAMMATPAFCIFSSVGHFAFSRRSLLLVR